MEHLRGMRPEVVAMDEVSYTKDDSDVTGDGCDDNVEHTSKDIANMLFKVNLTSVGSTVIVNGLIQPLLFLNTVYSKDILLDSEIDDDSKAEIIFTLENMQSLYGDTALAYVNLSNCQDCNVTLKDKAVAALISSSISNVSSVINALKDVLMHDDEPHFIILSEIHKLLSDIRKDFTRSLGELSTIEEMAKEK